MFISNGSLYQASRRIALSNSGIEAAVRANTKQSSEDNKRLETTLRENLERDIAARDRVDISLQEYLKMKRDGEDLSAENMRLKAFFRKIGLPINIPIIEGSIVKSYCGPSECLDFTGKFCIVFKCDMSTMSTAQWRQMLEEFNNAL